jgi:membrane protease YdiL (CAAX protease family)
MKMLKNIYQKYTYIISLTIFIAIFGLLFLFTYLFNQIIGSYIVVALIIIISIFIKKFKYFGFKTENLLKGLLYGLPIILGSIYTFLLSYFNVRNSRLITPWAYRTISFIFQMLSIGLLEEILCRGIILNILRNKLKNRKNGTLLAIIISSSLFGFAHLMNLVNSPPEILWGIISQIFYSMIIGMCYAIIYIKFNNIIVVIILHSLFNGIGLSPFIFLPINFWSIMGRMLMLHSKPIIALTDCILAIILLMYSIFLYKKWNK